MKQTEHGHKTIKTESTGANNLRHKVLDGIVNNSVSYKELLTSERSYQDDFKDENGMYESKCILCQRHFLGNKHKVVCKVCVNK